MNGMRYYHVDVFSSQPFSGNGLIVFTEPGGLDSRMMQLLTQEMRQFESIFLQEIRGRVVRARIFTCEEELDFAGHPVLGAAATLHDLSGSEEAVDWTFELNEKTVAVTTEKRSWGYDAVMNQGKALFGKVLTAAEAADVLGMIGASTDDLYPGLWPTVVSTGLRYLIVPFKDNRYSARVGAPGLEEKLHAAGAQFLGLLDIAARGIRTGTNDGSVEDIATGSLAGPAGAFLVAHGLEAAGTVIELRQGENLGRSSRLYVELRHCKDEPPDVIVKGSVCKIAQGIFW